MGQSLEVRLAGAFASLALVVSGCGYHLVRYGGSFGRVDSLAIQTPRNDSSEPGLEYVVAEALRREVLRRGGARLSEDPSLADLTISGRVPPVFTRTQSFSSVVLALEYEVTLQLDLNAKLRDGTAVPLEARVLSETERYFASADLEAMRKNREEALRRVAAVLAGRVMDALAEELAR